MISWSDKLFLSEKVNKKDIDKIKNNIDKGKLSTSLYCITFASNPKNLLDIFSSRHFAYPYYKKQKFHILGLAESKEKAYELVIEIIKEVYENTGDFKVRDYFS